MTQHPAARCGSLLDRPDGGPPSVCARTAGHPEVSAHLSADLISWGPGQWDLISPWVLAEVAGVAEGVAA